MQRRKTTWAGRDFTLDELSKSSYVLVLKIFGEMKGRTKAFTVKYFKDPETKTRFRHIAKDAKMQRKKRTCYGRDFTLDALSKWSYVPVFKISGEMRGRTKPCTC